MPKKLLYPYENFERYTAEKRTIMDSFIKDIEKLAGLNRISFSITDEWDKKAPSAATRPIQKFLNTVRAFIMTWRLFNLAIDIASYPTLRVIQQQPPIS
jgi:hypothetical protein